MVGAVEKVLAASRIPHCQISLRIFLNMIKKLASGGGGDNAKTKETT